MKESHIYIAMIIMITCAIIYSAIAVPIELRGGVYLRLSEILLTQSKILQRIQVDDGSLDGKFKIICDKYIDTSLEDKDIYTCKLIP